MTFIQINIKTPIIIDGFRLVINILGRKNQVNNIGKHSK